LNFVWFFRLGRVSELSLPYKEVGGGKTEKERERERERECKFSFFYLQKDFFIQARNFPLFLGLFPYSMQ
jgi:hypothetical protein